MASDRSYITLNARDIPVTTVTVYTDRAEVTRNFKVNLNPGFNEIQLENIAHSIQPESVRVHGQGLATIHEVKFTSKSINVEKDNTPTVNELKAELKKLEAEVQKERDLQSVYTARIETLNNLMGHGGSTKEAHPILSFDESLVSSLNKFFEFHEEKSVDTKAKARAAEERITSLTAEINRLNNEINQRQNVRQKK